MMKLSEAISLGAMLRPKGHGLFVQGRSCAMGAALEANGIEYNEDTSHNSPVILALPIISNSISHVQGCPAAHCLNTWSKSYLIVEHLNDYHDWTRERIAAWVSQVELPSPTMLNNVPGMALSNNTIKECV